MLDARSGSANAVSVRTFIDSQAISSYQWMVTAMCGLIVFVDGFDAQAVGFVFAAVTVVGYLSGATVLGVIGASFALVAAFLNAVFGLCLGCEAYLLLRRVATH